MTENGSTVNRPAEGLQEALTKAWASEEKGAVLTERVIGRLRDHIVQTLVGVLPSVDDEGNAASDVAEGIADNLLGLIGGYEPCGLCGASPDDADHGYGGSHAWRAAAVAPTHEPEAVPA